MTGHLDDRQLEAMLDGADPAGARAHLDVCTTCRAAIARKRALRQARRTSLPKLSAEQSARMAQRFARAIAAPPTPATRPQPRWYLGAASLAALAAAAAVLALVLPAHRESPPQSVARAPAPVSRAVQPPAERPTPAEPAPAPDPSPLVGVGAATPSPTASPAPVDPAAADQRAAQEPFAAAPGRQVSAAREQTDLDSVAGGDTAELLHKHANRLLQTGQLEQAADVYLASLAAAESMDQIEPALRGYKSLVKLHLRDLEPRAIAVRAEYIAKLVLPAPYAEEAGHLACESALAAKSYPSAYQLCRRYLELFPGSARTRDVAYLTASVARLYLGDCQSAIQFYSEALVFSGTLQSFNDEAYLGRALCHAQLGDLQAARSDLDLYLHKRPDQAASEAVRDLTRRLQDNQP
ncbi:MAG: hypothetical protein JXR83_18595 [Deltaproteobacteria bacterium]|nr:hypothetical protein [Deltaproteobacteria bacterium]